MIPGGISEGEGKMRQMGAKSVKGTLMSKFLQALRLSPILFLRDSMLGKAWHLSMPPFSYWLSVTPGILLPFLHFALCTLVPYCTYWLHLCAMEYASLLRENVFRKKKTGICYQCAGNQLQENWGEPKGEWVASTSSATTPIVCGNSYPLSSISMNSQRHVSWHFSLVLSY